MKSKPKPPKNPMPFPLLNIGDERIVWATVTFGNERDRDDNLNEIGPLKRRMYRQTVCPVKMIVVGATRRKLGIVHPTQGGRSMYDECWQGHIEVTETVFVYQCRQGLMRRIVEVLPFDLEVEQCTETA